MQVSLVSEPAEFRSTCDQLKAEFHPKIKLTLQVGDPLTCHIWQVLFGGGENTPFLWAPSSHSPPPHAAEGRSPHSLQTSGTCPEDCLANHKTQRGTRMPGCEATAMCPL